MPLIDAEGLRDRFDIDRDLRDGRLTPHIGSASRRLRKLVGEDKYAIAALPPDDQDHDADLTDQFRSAEAHLAMHFAILGFNSSVSHKGVFITETSTEGKAVRRYYSPDETKQLAQMYLDQAMDLVSEHIPDDYPAPPFAIVADETSCEGATRICRNGRSTC